MPLEIPGINTDGAPKWLGVVEDALAEAAKHGWVVKHDIVFDWTDGEEEAQWIVEAEDT